MKREITTKEQQEILLKMLIFFEEFCQAHNIKYSLAYGSMLGAIRHQGFIPWDDDVDLFMLREDYEKLVQCWTENDKYKLWHIFSEDNFFIGDIVKIFDTNTTVIEETPNHLINYGVFLDIFILDGIPDKYKQQKYHLQKHKLYRKLLTHCHRHGKFLNKLGKKFSFIPSISFFAAKINKLNNKYINSTYVATCTYDEKEINRGIYLRDTFKNIIHVPFEGHLLPVVKDYHNCLEKYYGDYMTPPPPEARTGHKIKAYINEQC